MPFVLALQPCWRFLLPIWTRKPALMAVTLRLLPQELQLTKYNRFSPRINSVSGDLHVLQLTYSTTQKRDQYINAPWHPRVDKHNSLM